MRRSCPLRWTLPFSAGIHSRKTWAGRGKAAMSVSINQHWVCFECRKQFRRTIPPIGLPTPKQEYEANERQPCPVCAAPTVNMGRYFCPPRRNDRRAWEQMRLLANEGMRFYSGGAKYCWRIEGVTQKSIRVTQRRLQKWKEQPRTQGEMLLQQIAQKRVSAKNRTRS